jgi:uncharacterized protein (TIGR03085 family)
MTAMTRYARDERRALCDTLLATGPDAPTLCEGWTTLDLAAHLVLRERRPDAEVGRLVPFLRGHAEAVRAARRDTPWPELVSALREGPPPWHPARLAPVDEAMNTAEMVVHHEDVLRAQPQWSARSLPDGLQAALWGSLRTVAPLILRRAPVGVELVAPGHGRLRGHGGSPVVRVEGAPSEVLLFVFGRRDQALVDLDGPNAAIDRLRATHTGP